MSSEAEAIAVWGRTGSGRSSAVRAAIIRLHPSITVLEVPLGSDVREGDLTRRLARELDAPPSLDGVLSALAARWRDRRVVLVIDELRPKALDEIRAIVELPRTTGTVGVVVVTDERGVRTSGLELDARFELPRLTSSQSVAYLRSWIRSARSPRAPVLLITPDAELLLADRAGGSLVRINRLARNALLLVARRGRRILTSLDAWQTDEDESPGLSDPGSSITIDPPPSGGPPREVTTRLRSLREDEAEGRAGSRPRRAEEHVEMSNLSDVKALPGVRSTSLGSTSGELLEALDEPDAESVVAVAGFAVHNFAEAGEQLGLGPLGDLGTRSPTEKLLVLLRGDRLVASRLEPSAPSRIDDQIRGAFDAEGGSL